MATCGSVAARRKSACQRSYACRFCRPYSGGTAISEMSVLLSRRKSCRATGGIENMMTSAFRSQGFSCDSSKKYSISLSPQNAQMSSPRVSQMMISVSGGEYTLMWNLRLRDLKLEMTVSISRLIPK